MIVPALIIAIALLLFYAIVLQLTIPGSWKFFLVAAEMIAVNQIFIRRYGLPSEIGLVLVKSRGGESRLSSGLRGTQARSTSWQTWAHRLATDF